MDIEEFRDTLEYTLGAVNDELNSMGYDPVPPQLIEAQVNLETGGTFDPGLVHPSSGATGLGQIMTGGLEYGHYRDAVDPTITPDRLTDPETNLRVMIHGMAYRKELGEQEREAGGTGAWADWMMAAAGYLGGANNAGFNTAADSNGTTGMDYVRTLQRYIRGVWGDKAADDIDVLGEGAAVAAGGNWESGAITFDPDAPGTDRKGEIAALASLFETYGDGLLEPQDEGRDTSVQGQVTAAVMAALGPLVDMVKEYAPRVGIALAGIVAASMGAYVLTRGGEGS